MRDPHPLEQLPLLVLTGAGRSGTTALRMALGDHPQIISNGHANNLACDLLESARTNRTGYTRRYAMQVDDATHDALFQRLIFDLLFPDAAAGAPNQTVFIFSNLFPDTAQYLIEARPNTKIIALVRNGIDVISSRMKHGWLGETSFERHCEIWSNAAALDTRAQSLPPESYLSVRYEEMSRDPDALCARIAQFAGLESSSAPADHLKRITYHPTARDGLERWASWTGEQRRSFEAHCTESMRHFGYEIPWKATVPV